MGKQASERANSATMWLVEVIATDLESMEATDRLVGGEEVGVDADLVLFASGDAATGGAVPVSDVYAITVRKLDEDEVTDILDRERMAQAHRDLSADLDAEEASFAAATEEALAAKP